MSFLKNLMTQRSQDYLEGFKEGIKMYAWWKDGVQYIGTTGTTLKEALKEIEKIEEELKCRY